MKVPSQLGAQELSHMNGLLCNIAARSQGILLNYRRASGRRSRVVMLPPVDHLARERDLLLRVISKRAESDGRPPVLLPPGELA